MVLYFVLLWLCFCFWWLLGFVVVDVLCWYYHLIVLVFVIRAVGLCCLLVWLFVFDLVYCYWLVCLVTFLG